MADYDFSKPNALRSLLASGSRGTFNDSGIPGLSLYVGNREAVWRLVARLHGKKIKRRIGDATRITYSVARDRAGQARLMIQRGEDPKEWLQEQEFGGKKQEAPTEPEAASETSWEAIRDAYLKEKAHPSYGLREASLKSAAQSLEYETVSKHLSGKDIREITKQDLVNVRNEIWKKGKRAQAKKCVRDLNSLWSFLDENRPDLGVPLLRIKQSPSKNLPREEDVPTGRLPTPEELGEAERRLNGSGLAPQIRIACLLTFFTAQRIHTVSHARPEDFQAIEDGWILWEAGHTKRRRERGQPPHTVPLPPPVAKIVENALGTFADDEWLFPAMRSAKKGVEPEGPIAKTNICKAFRTSKLGFQPHGVRRAFRSYMIGHVPPETIAGILHHSEGKSGDTGSEYYDFSMDIPEKQKAMLKWLELLEEFKKKVPEAA